MPDAVLSQQKTPKLIMVVAFDPDDDDNMQTVFGPTDILTEERAIRTAKVLSTKHAAVIAWSREANPTIGEFGEPTTVFTHGNVRA